MDRLEQTVSTMKRLVAPAATVRGKTKSKP
jgi:hypothetical protein